MVTATQQFKSYVMDQYKRGRIGIDFSYLVDDIDGSKRNGIIFPIGTNGEDFHLTFTMAKPRGRGERFWQDLVQEGYPSSHHDQTVLYNNQLAWLVDNDYSELCEWQDLHFTKWTERGIRNQSIGSNLRQLMLSQSEENWAYVIQQNNR